MKRLNTRLESLEAAAGGDVTLSPVENTLLVQILGRRDALFWPWRICQTSRPPMPEIRQRQREYHRGVAGVSARADGRSQWKLAHETRQRLVGAGMLTAVGANGETVSVILTAQGESVARALVGSRLASRADAEVALAILQAMVEILGSPVRESVLFGEPCVGNPDGWNHRTELMLPLLAAGVVQADSDTQGRILYSLVDGVELPAAVESPTEAESSFDEVYLTSFDAQRAWLMSVEPRDPSEVYVPVSVSLHWPKVENASDEK